MGISNLSFGKIFYIAANLFLKRRGNSLLIYFSFLAENESGLQLFGQPIPMQTFVLQTGRKYARQNFATELIFKQYNSRITANRSSKEGRPWRRLLRQIAQ
jgi:hypothetical protein